MPSAHINARSLQTASLQLGIMRCWFVAHISMLLSMKGVTYFLHYTLALASLGHRQFEFFLIGRVWSYASLILSVLGTVLSKVALAVS